MAPMGPGQRVGEARQIPHGNSQLGCFGDGTEKAPGVRFADGDQTDHQKPTSGAKKNGFGSEKMRQTLFESQRFCEEGGAPDWSLKDG